MTQAKFEVNRNGRRFYAKIWKGPTGFYFERTGKIIHFAKEAEAWAEFFRFVGAICATGEDVLK